MDSISRAVIGKASILGDTIDYLKELERRVEYLESYMGDLEAKGGKKHPDVAERTSDNYGRDEIACGKKSPLSKRKACDVDEQGFENHWILSKDGIPMLPTLLQFRGSVIASPGMIKCTLQRVISKC